MYQETFKTEREPFKMFKVLYYKFHKVHDYVVKYQVDNDKDELENHVFALFERRETNDFEDNPGLRVVSRLVLHAVAKAQSKEELEYSLHPDLWHKEVVEDPACGLDSSASEWGYSEDTTEH